MSQSQSLLLESLGYKQESPRRTNIGESSQLLNDYSTSYNQSNPHRRASHQFDYESKSNFNPSQPLQPINQNNFFPSNSNNPSSFISSSHMDSMDMHQQPQSFFGSPKRNNRASNIEIKDDNNISSKYASIPRKSMLSSGLGAISPIPRPKYISNQNVNNKLDLNNTNTAESGSLMPAISPIKHKISNTNNNNNTLFSDNLHGLNSTHNTLNLSNIGGPNPMESRMSIIRAENVNDISNNKQILIIGFPASEASFIHRKFRHYGNGIVNAQLNKNTLFLEYLNKEGANRALAENAKWIKNGNLLYD
eukprot:961010_1